MVQRNLVIAAGYWAACAVLLALSLLGALPFAVGNALSVLLHIVTLGTIVWMNRSKFSKVRNIFVRGLATFSLSVAVLFVMAVVLYGVSVPVLYALGVLQ